METALESAFFPIMNPSSSGSRGRASARCSVSSRSFAIIERTYIKTSEWTRCDVVWRCTASFMQTESRRLLTFLAALIFLGTDE